MVESGKIWVTSETGPLKRVMMHRPGRELDRVHIKNKEEFLFDDIIWLDHAVREHDAFASVLTGKGAEVIYFKDCLSEILEDESVRVKLLDDAFALEALDYSLSGAMKYVLSGVPSYTLADILIAGITKREAVKMGVSSKSMVSLLFDDDDFFIRPLSNLYFQRDPYVFIKNSAILSVMHFPVRQREPLYASYILKHHEYFKDTDVIFGDGGRDSPPYMVEGGDILVLSEDCAAIGVSERTSPGSAQVLASRMASWLGIRRVIVVEIPKRRSYTHLDTVLTMVDRDAFMVYPGVLESARVWELVLGEDGSLVSAERCGQLSDCLKRALRLDSLRFIQTGGGDPVIASRDQWHDATNILAVSPGEVVAYSRNQISNRVLRENGISVIEIDGEELGRGRGGPRCMALPVMRSERI